MSLVSERVAIFDLGKTNAKMILRDTAHGVDITSRSIPNTVLSDGVYPHYDLPRLQSFVLASLTDFTKIGAIDAIMVSTHGACIACLSKGNLALPVMDYDFDGPDTCAVSYERIRADSVRTGSPRMPRGLNIGAQLHWLVQNHATEMARVDQLLFWPQYWTYWLSGVATSEIAYAGCHTDLWDIQAQTFIDLPNLGLDIPGLMPPFVRSGTSVGPMKEALCKQIGASIAPRVLCGAHDSSLALVPFALDHTGPVTVLSTGTWICAFSLNGTNRLAMTGAGQMVSLDPFGGTVPNVRFMGGQILARLMSVPEIQGPKVTPKRLEGVFDAETTWLADQQGNRLDPRLIPQAARLDIYSRLLGHETIKGLIDIDAQGPIIIDGPFADNAAFIEVLTNELGSDRVRSGIAPGVTGGIDRLIESPRRDKIPQGPRPRS